MNFSEQDRCLNVEKGDGMDGGKRLHVDLMGEVIGTNGQ